MITLDFSKIEPKYNNTIELDGGAWYTLEPCTDWDRAQFRIPCVGGEIMLATNVFITGRKVQTTQQYGVFRVRVKIEFPGDCEPDTYEKGWLYIGSNQITW